VGQKGDSSHNGLSSQAPHAATQGLARSGKRRHRVRLALSCDDDAPGSAPLGAAPIAPLTF